MNEEKRIFIDVREAAEYAAGHVDGAINLPLSNLGQDAASLASLPKNTELVLYCNSGNRSGIAMDMLNKFGFTNLANGVNKAQVEALYLK